MTPIQIVLIIGLGIIALMYFAFFRSILLDRIAVVTLFGAGALAVLNPDITTSAAHLVGVGRGTDLLFYLSFITLLFLCVILYSRIARLEEDLTRITRHLAWRDGRKCDDRR